MISRPKIELLAPAGDLERLNTAIRFGADAVYLGGPSLQLRADAVAFDMDKLEIAVETAHSWHRKVYVTVNSYGKNHEIDTVGDYAKQLYELGVDAVIVADLGVMMAIKAAAPDLEIHVSTQANCQNYMAARTYYDMGAKRVVLGREMTLEEIRILRDKTPKELELEAFVHGAMCMSFSGRCLLSAFLNNRSGNRGECTQPCRWQYHLVEQNRPGEFFPIEESENGSAILSSFDLNCIEFLDQIIDAGVTSLKIEGRMKSPYYVATVVNAYRRALRGNTDMELLKRELNAASHRPYSSGFYFGEMKKHNPTDSAYYQDCTFCGVVKESDGETAVVEQRNRFRIGDRLEILSPHSMGESFVVDYIMGEEGCEMMSASHPMELVEINCPFELEPGDILRRRDKQE